MLHTKRFEYWLQSPIRRRRRQCDEYINFAGQHPRCRNAAKHEGCHVAWDDGIKLTWI